MAKKTKTEQTDGIQVEPRERTFTVDWEPSADVTPRYVNHLWMNHTADEFILNFFEIHPPLGPLDPERVDKVAALKPDCVARLVVAPGRMKAFLEVMTKNVEQYAKTHLGDDDDA